MRGIDALSVRAFTVLDTYLRPDARAPVLLALSGGSDSTAMALITADWARANGRDLMVCTIDHRLTPDSLAWTQTCADLAARLKLPFTTRAWLDDKPTTGLPAKARQARHLLLCTAARDFGVRVILMGHTSDDQVEAVAMRASGSTTPSPRTWAPAPLWPEGRGLFILRPLLAERRAALRSWLAARGETWIDDPANANLKFARARARARIAIDPGAAAPPAQDRSELSRVAQNVRMDVGGGLHLDRRTLYGLSPSTRRELVAILCLCAAGTARPPRAQRVEAVVELLMGDRDGVLGLAGARIAARGDALTFAREIGELKRRPHHQVPGVWDGRYEVTSNEGLVPAWGRLKTLSSGDEAFARDLTPAVRHTLPYREGLELNARPLALDRFEAATGLISQEPV